MEGQNPVSHGNCLERQCIEKQKPGVSLEGKSFHIRKALFVGKQHCVECFPDVPTH